MRDGQLLGDPFLNIGDRLTAGGERGLLGLAFHPDFPDDPRFFVNYTDLDGDTVVSSFTAEAGADRADGDSEVVLLRIEQPYPNHNGGALAFGPDGYLYISTGDGGSGGDPHDNGQRMDTLLGKILRIDVDGGPATRATRSHPTTRSWTSPTPCPRSGTSGCATRGGCRSIARPATCGSATSARAAGRRSTSPAPGSAG